MRWSYAGAVVSGENERGAEPGADVSRPDTAVPGAERTAAVAPTSAPGGAPDPMPATGPLDVDGTATVGIGTALWAVAGLVLTLFYRDELVADGRQWWLWTCLAGFGLGLIGWGVCRRRRDRLRSSRA